MKPMTEALLDRRDVLKLSLLGLGTLYLSGCRFYRTSPSATAPAAPNDFLARFGPIDRAWKTPGDAAFTGDDFTRPHEILWNKDGYLSGNAASDAVETVPLVVIGGGIAGLTSTYLLRHHQPVLLEQAPRFGGNAKGEGWDGIDYALGAAYIDKPKPGSVMARFCDELGLADLFAERSGHDPVEWGGKIYPHFWDGETEPAHRKAYRRLADFFQELHRKEVNGYPEIPCPSDAHRRSVDFWDRTNLHAVLRERIGALPPHLETLIEHYCWSTYGASAREVSAASALNFLANDAATIYIAPGGNAGIAERVLKKTLDVVPPDRLRTSSLVVDVKVDDTGVDVLYEDAARKPRRLRAKAAVFAAPKFVAKRVVRDLEPARVAAIGKVKYRAYLVANVLLNEKERERFYDLYMTGDGKTDVRDARNESLGQGATDVILATFARPHPTRTVLTLYKPLPYDTGRAELFASGSIASVRKTLEEQVMGSVLPMLGYAKTSVADLRVTRWGHALPVAEPGTFTSGLVDELRKPFRKRLFFVEQDNWLKPALKTGVTEAYAWKDAVEETLRS